ncbi:hypothetical protein [Halomonas sp. QHL1]|uniref:hypothetical protein n=1 Tax=Halomonas sp. QHL1 TaxID=1123773 RepID=UPI001114CF98|nr:hypothetical protein [Halomonas sp. QHL1]
MGRLLQALLDRLHHADQLDWERVCMDNASVPAKKGARPSTPNPTDRFRPGSKRHLLTDRQAAPLAILLSGVNMHGNVPLAALLDSVPPVSLGRPVRPRCHPRKLHTD